MQTKTGGDGTNESHAPLLSAAPPVTYRDASAIKTVLVAIHDEGIGQTIADLLRELGYDLVMVTQTHEAVCVLASREIDLVVSEATTADRTAMDLHNVLRAWPHVPVLVVADPIDGSLLGAAVQRALVR